MQLEYLKEIDGKFALPVLRFPLMAEEIRGLDLLREATIALDHAEANRPTNPPRNERLITSPALPS